MNIKSLLLGSAAAMVAVSGAQAADAVVVEPEPVEYVRVCDAYGSGFFYIPGTETCLNFNGYVRTTYHKEQDDDAAGVETERTLWQVRGRFNIDARNETDWGTLRSQIRFQGNGNGDGGNSGIEMDRALISIGGFRAGLSDDYWTTNHGYAGVNAAGVGITIFDDGNYGFSNNIFMDYTYAVDGLAITVGVEDRGFEGVTNAGGTDGQGNFYAGVNYSGDGWGAAFTAANEDASTTAAVAASAGPDGLDGTADDVAAAAAITNRGGWAYKVSLDVDLGDVAPGAFIHGMYMWEDPDAAVGGFTSYVGADSLWQVSAQMNLGDNAELWAQYNDASDVGGVLGADREHWSIGVNWYPVSGLKVLASYQQQEVTNAAGVTTSDVDAWMIGVRRSF